MNQVSLQIPQNVEWYKVTLGRGRENISVLATVNADGRIFAPLIVYAGKNWQSTWQGHKYLPDTMYSVSDSGWMTSEVFFSWFEQVCVAVKEGHLLLVYDGHKTHLSVKVIKKAIKEKIRLVKLPPHCTDLLQPLDKCCFGSLKRMWEGKLNVWVSFSSPRKPISKDVFCKSPFQNLEWRNFFKKCYCRILSYRDLPN